MALVALGSPFLEVGQPPVGVGGGGGKEGVIPSSGVLLPPTEGREVDVYIWEESAPALGRRLRPLRRPWVVVCPCPSYHLNGSSLGIMVALARTTILRAAAAQECHLEVFKGGWPLVS